MNSDEWKQMGKSKCKMWSRSRNGQKRENRKNQCHHALWFGKSVERNANILETDYSKSIMFASHNRYGWTKDFRYHYSNQTQSYQMSWCFSSSLNLSWFFCFHHNHEKKNQFSFVTNGKAHTMHVNRCGKKTRAFIAMELFIRMESEQLSPFNIRHIQRRYGFKVELFTAEVFTIAVLTLALVRIFSREKSGRKKCMMCSDRLLSEICWWWEPQNILLFFRLHNQHRFCHFVLISFFPRLLCMLIFSPCINPIAFGSFEAVPIQIDEHNIIM